METVIITGGRGASGRWIVDRLAGEYEVVVIDYEHPGLGVTPATNVSFRAADLADRGETLDVVSAVNPDAVVHWAAIPVAGTHPAGRVFETNVLAAHNVLTAAGRADARIVQASSDGAYGFFFADPTPLPDALPVTEDHPLRPEDPYGLSKVTAEETAAAVARAHDVPAVSIRPSWIQYPGAYACREEEYVDDLDAGAGNFWSYVDVRDVADLVAAALDRTGDATGAGDVDAETDEATSEPSDAGVEDGPAVPAGTHEAINCVAADNALGRPLRELIGEVYGELPAETNVDPGDDRGAYAIRKAKRLFDWQPSRSWRTAASETVAEPTLLER